MTAFTAKRLKQRKRALFQSRRPRHRTKQPPTPPPGVYQFPAEYPYSVPARIPDEKAERARRDGFFALGRVVHSVPPRFRIRPVAEVDEFLVPRINWCCYDSTPPPGEEIEGLIRSFPSYGEACRWAAHPLPLT